MVEIQQWSAHHSTQNWNDPWRFNPDRFLVGPDKAAEAGDNLSSLQPFSAGPRNCIGRKYDITPILTLPSSVG
jgi:cytochrome P450